MKLLIVVSLLVIAAKAQYCASEMTCKGCLANPGCGWFADVAPNGTAPEWRCVSGSQFACPQCKGDSYFYTTSHCPDDPLPELMLQRRSIRAYTTDRLSHAIIAELLRLGTWAPTAVHAEPWRFIVVQDQKLLLNISAQINPSAPERIFYGAPAVVFVYTEKAIEGFAEVDCGLGMQNIMLAAYRVGLATCPIGYTRLATDYINKILGVPSSYSYCLALTLGHPAMTATSTRKSPVIAWID